MATIEDVTADSGLVTVLGPEAADTLAEIVLGSAAHAAEVEDLTEGEFLEGHKDEDDRFGRRGVRIARTSDVDVPAWDVFASAGRFREVWDSLIKAGAAPIGAGVWDTLRVEAGRPVYGGDMDESTILSETGLVDRAVDHTKGCYTGQEVIVRIRDRGHVNRSLRGLLLAEGPAPQSGTELFREDRVVGGITSVVESPPPGWPDRTRVRAPGRVARRAGDRGVADRASRWDSRVGSGLDFRVDLKAVEEVQRVVGATARAVWCSRALECGFP